MRRKSHKQPLSLFVAKVCDRNENERDSTDKWERLCTGSCSHFGFDRISLLVKFPRAFFFEEFEVSEHVSHRNCFLGCGRSGLVVALGHNPLRAECLPFVF